MKSKLLHWMMNGGLRSVWRLLYDQVIAAELAAQRTLDATVSRQRQAHHPLVDEKLTAVIKTFERPAILQRLVGSIRRRYPHLPIIVVDDSRTPVKIDGVRTIVMPYNSGISAGRNVALKEVQTKYVMILDDDFIFYRHTDLQPALEVMERLPQIDIMGGQVVNLPRYTSRDHRKVKLFPNQVEPVFPAGSRIGDLPVLEKVANFFVARTERLRLVPWDNQLKKLEHNDFFTRARGILTTVYNERLRCLHAQTPFDREYMKVRRDFHREMALLRDRWYSE